MGVFDRIVVGVDGSEFGFEALQQALVLRAAQGTLQAVTVLEEAVASHTGFLASDAAAQIEKDAELTYKKAVEILDGHPFSTARMVKGAPTAALLASCEKEQATLMAVGGRHRSRTAGLLLSGVATVVLHDAPCSVLFAHPRWGERWYPQRIVVGLDGSAHSLAALSAADELAERLGSAVRVVAATGGKRISTDEPWADRVDEWVGAHPVVALVDASVQADLVAVGSRGLHGIRSLGSVGERVAHQSHSSVLVVHESAQAEPTASSTGSAAAEDVDTA